ncbi:MAG: ATP synthase F1 subunit epsilon [Bacilli bacterium]|nr:ATP synthase F1 subunit epsilon [Bacilli bacterium]
MEKVLHVEILTPNGKYLQSDVEFLSVKSTVAQLGILPNHAPLITQLEICKLVIKKDGANMIYAIGGGVLTITKGSNVKLLVNSIEHKDEIDLERALKAKERALKRIEEKQKHDSTRAKAALARALNRINIVNNY